MIHSSTSIYYTVNGHCVHKQTKQLGEARVPTELGFNLKLDWYVLTRQDMLSCWGWVQGGTHALEKSVSFSIILFPRAKVIRGSRNTISQESSFLLSLGEMPEHNILIRSHVPNSRTDQGRDGCTWSAKLGGRGPGLKARLLGSVVTLTPPDFADTMSPARAFTSHKVP